MDFMQNNNNNILNVLSIILALENLQENREQSKQNDVQSANDKQAEFLLKEIDRKFEEQNKMLEEIRDIVKDLRGDGNDT